MSCLPNVKSTSTVHRYYREWRDAQETKHWSKLEKMGGYSEEFTQAFVAEVTRLTASKKEHYEAKAEAACSDWALAVEELDRSEQQVLDLNIALEALNGELNDVRAAASEATKADAATLQELRKQLEDLKNDNRRLSESNESLGREVAKAQATEEHNDRLLTELRSQRQSLVEELKTLSKEIADSRRDLTQCGTEAVALRETINQLKGKEAALSNELNSVRLAHNAAQEDLRNKYNSAMSDVRQLRYELNFAQRQIAEGNDRLKSVEAQLVASQRTVAEQSAVIDVLKKPSSPPNDSA
ncbi:MAG: hypothetical protein EOO52_13585 [Gammaproteobacteria bacterium]|nr:MAG: hypothetical protein EOO52_13585 [Gammaproteobacteria bacterium]